LIVFANWRGFSGGQRDMFDEVLKYGSLIVDAFCSYEQPVFVFIPPFAEIRGGAWVVLDSSINPSVMEMYAASGSARGGVLEANGAASVKYRTKDMISTMHRLDDKLRSLDESFASAGKTDKEALLNEITARENALLPVYEQIAVQFCELHDTPGRMKSVGVIRAEVDWMQARSFFYWRLRRQLAYFDLRRQLIDAASVGRGVRALTPQAAGDLIESWFLASRTREQWEDDKLVLEWMAKEYTSLERNIQNYAAGVVAQEVLHVMTAGGQTANVGMTGILQGLSLALDRLSVGDRERVKSQLELMITRK
jgi:acetyl-CoA carboxylase/biotin carboxylase 1